MSNYNLNPALQADIEVAREIVIRLGSELKGKKIGESRKREEEGKRGDDMSVHIAWNRVVSAWQGLQRAGAESRVCKYLLFLVFFFQSRVDQRAFVFGKRANFLLLGVSV